jgi:hypothetical protein
MHNNIKLPGEIIDKLFTSGSREEKGKSVFVKQKYAEYVLNRNWVEICGERLAKYCCVYKVEGNEVVIHTENSILANELFMMKDLLLQKINSYLPEKIVIKKISFQASSKIKQYQKPEANDEAASEAKTYTKPCAKCGVIVQSDNALCDVCTREEKEILKFKIAELLKVQPWLKYEDCGKYFSCDRILFNAVKDSLQNAYFERVRLDTADEFDCHMAVMFLTGKSPEEIDDKIFENSLAYLRRNQNVSTPWFRLYGKK